MRCLHTCAEADGIPLLFTWRQYSADGPWLIYELRYGRCDSFAGESHPPALRAAAAETAELVRAWLRGAVDRLPADALDVEAQRANLTPNQMRVLTTLYETVPRGSVVSYRELGERAGFGPRAARFVGTAMRLNPWPLFVPCHRVVLSSGQPGNYSFGPPSLKERLLRAEGWNAQ